MTGDESYVQFEKITDTDVSTFHCPLLKVKHSIRDNILATCINRNTQYLHK